MATKRKPKPKPAPAPAAEKSRGPEGWGAVRPREKVSHYYRNGASLCHQVGLYRGPLEADTGKPGPDDCPRCQKRLADMGTPA